MAYFGRYAKIVDSSEILGDASKRGEIMRLLLNNAFSAAPIVHPFVAGWVEAPAGIEVAAILGLRASDVPADDCALIPLAEFAFLHESHQIVPDVAVVAGNTGMVAMRCPVRPDEIGITPVRLWEVDGAAEILARATLRSFYGIHATIWTRTDAEPAEVVIVSGAAAVALPEAGFSEDLCRAWVILTGMRAVDHVLVAPRAVDRDALEPTLRFLALLHATGHERRRELRREIAEPFGLDRDRLAEVQNAYSFALEAEDRVSLAVLLQRGTPGSAYPSLGDITFLPDAP